MASYSYDSSNFGAGPLFLDELQYLISKVLNVSYCEADGDLSSGTYTTKIVFDNELTEPEKLQLDNIISSYTPPCEYTQNKALVTIIKDTKPIATNGGGFSRGIWTRRELNTVEGNLFAVRLGDNSFTLIPGNYLITITACACGVSGNTIRLVNLTQETICAIGMSSFADSSNTFATLSCVVNVTDRYDYAIEHICEKTVDKIGFGRANGYGDEIYLTCVISIC